MKAKYCIVPDKNKFFAFLAEQSLTEAELLRARLIQPEKIFMDIEAAVWQIEYKAVAPVTETLLAAVANKLTAAFNLKKVELQQTNLLETSVVAESVKTENKLETENKSVQVEPEREEIPLPPEEPEAVEIGEAAAFEAVPSCEAERKDDAYEKAYNLLYGGNKKADGLIFGKAFKGKPRPMIDVIEEENRVVVEGAFVKSIDKDGKLTAFIERVLRTGNVMLTFNLSDETSGLYVRMRFENLEECLQFKKKIKPGMQLRIMGNVAPDRFLFDEMVISPQGIIAVPKKERMDNAEVKRVELHCHTKMSDMDGVSEVKSIVKRAHDWGHPAIAITDHGVAQSFPDANHYIEGLDKDDPFKVIYGVEGYLVDDLTDVAVNEKGQMLDDTYVVFDLETTGFSPIKDKIIEIGAVKVERGKITERFSTFVNPKVPIPFQITQLTSITDQMVMDAPDIETVLPKFLAFVGDAVLVAHNASFDVGFIEQNCRYQDRIPDFTSVHGFYCRHFQSSN